MGVHTCSNYGDDSMYVNYILLGSSINHTTDLGELCMVQMKEKGHGCNRSRTSRATYKGGDKALTMRRVACKKEWEQDVSKVKVRSTKITQ
jgi:hypothetical protein